MDVGKIENGLECGFVKHCLNCLLITDPVCFEVEYGKVDQISTYKLMKCFLPCNIFFINDSWIGHFQVAVNLTMKARLSEKLFIIKLVLFAYE